MTDSDTLARLLAAAKLHVPFDGWSAATFDAAVTESGVGEGMARAVCPRGAVNLALAYHAEGDNAMATRLEQTDLSEMRFRDRVAAAVRFRLEAVEDKDLVRRGLTLFSLPHYAGDGAQALWGTADRIWTALGDSATDINWYTKRMTLSGVYAATVLYWLGDDSDEHANTWAFLDRRIDNVMQFEKFKAQARDNRLISGLMAGPLAFLNRVKAPENDQQAGMPGRWHGPG